MIKLSNNKPSCSLKMLRSEPYMNPNNWDITFEPTNVPSNIELESAYNLERRLQKLMPLTKKVHLNLGTKDLHLYDCIDINTSLKINGKEVKFI